MLQISVSHTAKGPISRRSLLRASLAPIAAPALARASDNVRRAETAVIQLWLGGGPSHLDMYDLKPEAPAEIRGSFQPIATNVQGLKICELLPRQSRMMDKFALLRSFHHATNDHPQGAHWTQCGHFAPITPAAVQPTHPSAGSVTSRLRGANRPGMVPYVHIAPDPMGFPVFIHVHEAAHLGAEHNPLRVEYPRLEADMHQRDLYKLIGKPEFSTPSLDPLPGVPRTRWNGRDVLLKQFEQPARLSEANRVADFRRQHDQALELVTSDAARRAFDLGLEDPRLRERYGLNSWGQGLLLCRRLVEAGVTFVTLNTDSFSGQWDSHVHLARDFRVMLPVYDQMLTALVEDLTDRGLYERVLVLVWGEFGRTPKINAGGGRDHWGASGFAMLGGGGLKGGLVLGKTDSQGAFPTDRPVWPQDILATVYHVLGIDPETELPDREGRPIKVLASGEPIQEIC